MELLNAEQIRSLMPSDAIDYVMLKIQDKIISKARNRQMKCSVDVSNIGREDLKVLQDKLCSLGYACTIATMFGTCSTLTVDWTER